MTLNDNILLGRWCYLRQCNFSLKPLICVCTVDEQILYILQVWVLLLLKPVDIVFIILLLIN